VTAHLVSEVAGVSVNEQGTHILLHFKDAAKNPFNIAVPEQFMLSLMAVASHGAMEAQKKLRKDKRVRHVMPCQRWEIWLDNDPKQDQKLVFSFRVSNGIQLSFRLQLAQLPSIVAVLQATAGFAAPPPAGTTKQ
jgi:hypothetical protein